MESIEPLYLGQSRAAAGQEQLKMKFNGYIARWNFLLEKSRKKSVLHLGCIGITEGTLAEKIEAMNKGTVLHSQLRKTAKDLVGIDYDQSTVQELNKNGFEEILYGNVEELILPRTFDLVLCGDLIEHLSNPGKMLERVKLLLSKNGELIITTPNAFGLVHFFKYIFGRFQEGNDHVISFSRFTLSNLLGRHDFEVHKVYTCYDRPPQNWKDSFRYFVGIPFFKMFPRFGGTLVVMAKWKNGGGRESLPQ